ncbi:MAG: hypothetical protein KDA96_06355 [Planctomycetaceae bacterium]|nr:hypothetical protein [Planctomycetaceae bacterium]
MSDSVLQRFSTRPNDNVEPLEAEQCDDLGAFGWLRGTRERAIMLELRRKDGNILAVGYAWLDKAEFDPSQGITLSLGGHKIKIRGRNLNTEIRPNVRLFQGISRHRVPWIQEADEPAVMEAQDQGVLVEEIEW